MIRGFYLRRLCLMSIKREKLKNVSFAPAPAVCRQHTSGTPEKAKNVSFFETKRVQTSQNTSNGVDKQKAVCYNQHN